MGDSRDTELGGEQVAKLPSDDGDDAFGWAVALDESGTTALVSAVDDEDPNGREGEYLTGAGSASVYTRTDDGWTRQTKLAPDDGEAGDNFGYSVALSADGMTALVGAARADVSEPRQGACYLFNSTDGEWDEAAKLCAEDPVVGDRLGGTVALSADGTTAIASAPLATPSSTDSYGAVYVFTDDSDGWGQQAKLIAPEAAGGTGLFGYNLALDADGSTALLSAADSDGAGGFGAGLTVVYDANSGNWTVRGTLEPDDGDRGDRFGSAVALDESGTTAVVGAYEDTDPNGSTTGPDGETVGAGSAYVFTVTEGTWGQVTKLSADDGDGGDLFGATVAIDDDGTTAIVGAANDDDPNGIGAGPYTGAGSAYVFARDGGGWTQRAKLSASDGDSNDGFASSIALSGDGGDAIAGAPGDEDPHGGTDEFAGLQGGSAYVFE